MEGYRALVLDQRYKTMKIIVLPPPQKTFMVTEREVNSCNVAKHEDHNSFSFDPPKGQHQAMSIIFVKFFNLCTLPIQVTNILLVIPIILFHCKSVTVQANILSLTYAPFPFRIEQGPVSEEPSYQREKYVCLKCHKNGCLGSW